jgi:hypothetical protein
MIVDGAESDGGPPTRRSLPEGVHVAFALGLDPNWNANSNYLQPAIAPMIAVIPSPETPMCRPATPAYAVKPMLKRTIVPPIPGPALDVAETMRHWPRKSSGLFNGNFVALTCKMRVPILGKSAKNKSNPAGIDLRPTPTLPNASLATVGCGS